jgi:hypothetical protein
LSPGDSHYRKRNSQLKELFAYRKVEDVGDRRCDCFRRDNRVIFSRSFTMTRKGCALTALGCFGSIVCVIFVFAVTNWWSGKVQEPKLDRLVARDLSVLHVGDSCDTVRANLKRIGARTIQPVHRGCLSLEILERVPMFPFDAVAQIQMDFGKPPYTRLIGVQVNHFADGL